MVNIMLLPFPTLGLSYTKKFTTLPTYTALNLFKKRQKLLVNIQFDCFIISVIVRDREPPQRGSSF